MTSATDVYNDLIAQHGGLEAFSTVQLQIARSVVKLMASLQVASINDVGKMAQIAQTLERLLSQLPPAIQRAPTSGVETLTEFEQRLAGLTLAEKTPFYAAELNTPSPVRITPEEQAILDARVDRILDGILLRRDPGAQRTDPDEADRATNVATVSANKVPSPPKR